MQGTEDSAYPAPPEANPGLAQRVLAWVLDHWIVLACASWLAGGLLYLTLPPSTDQFNHAYMGWRLLMGDVPYRDFIDPNWPGVMGLHALAVALFGINLWSWRAFDFLLFTITALLLADLTRLAAGRTAARLSLVLLPLTYVSAGYWMAGQHDMSASQFLVCAVWFHVRACLRQCAGWQLATGLFVGAAMLNKPTVGVVVPLLLLLILWQQTFKRTTVAHALAMTAGLIAALLAAAVAVLLTGASARDLIDSTYTFNLNTQHVSTVASATRGMAYMAWYIPWELARGNWVLMLGSLPALYWLYLIRPRSIAAMALAALWLTGVLSCLIQARGYPYHLSPSILALATMLPISLAVVADGRVHFGRGAWGVALPVALALVIAVGLGHRLVYLYGSVPRALATGQFEDHLDRYNAGDYVSVAESLEFAQRLASRPPSECVLVVGTLSAINYLSQRPQPTRFYYFPVVNLARPPLPMAHRWIDLWEADLRTANCHFVLVADWVRKDWLSSKSPAAAALRQHLQAYRETGTLGAAGRMFVYERN